MNSSLLAVGRPLPCRADPRFSQGRRLLRAGDREGARALYSRIATGGDRDARKLSALHLASLDMYESARPGQARILRGLGRSLEEDFKDLGSAEEIYHEAVEYQDPFAIRFLAEVYTKAGDHASAVRTARVALTLGESSVIVDLGQHVEKTGDLRRAAELYWEACPGDLQAMRLFVLVEERLGHHDVAAETAREAANRGHASIVEELARTRQLNALRNTGVTS